MRLLCAVMLAAGILVAQEPLPDRAQLELARAESQSDRHVHRRIALVLWQMNGSSNPG